MAEDSSCSYQPDGTRAVIPARRLTYGAPVDAKLPWTAEAEERIRRVPSFVRAVVVKRVEDFARREGYNEVTSKVMSEVRKKMPVDFSKRLPFFSQHD